MGAMCLTYAVVTTCCALTAIIHASAQVAKLFSAARDAVKEDKLRDVSLFRVPGSHIGFEDKLSLEPSPLTNNFITKPIFAIINFLVYKVRSLHRRLKHVNRKTRFCQIWHHILLPS
jgi:hypothetical protein